MAGAVEIWLLDVSSLARDLLALEAEVGLLSPDDRAGAASIAEPGVASRRLAGLVALRLLLSGIAGREMACRAFERGASGKPRLPGAPCHFNLSHSAGRSLVAISTHEVGADLETPRIVQIDGTRRLLIEWAGIAIAGGAALPEAGPEPRFLQAWTRLEALAKADGCGIGRLLTLVGVVGRKRDPRETDLPAEVRALAERFQTRDLVLDRSAVGAIAAAPGVASGGSILNFPSEPQAMRRLLETPRTLGGN